MGSYAEVAARSGLAVSLCKLEPLDDMAWAVILQRYEAFRPYMDLFGTNGWNYTQYAVTDDVLILLLRSRQGLTAALVFLDDQAYLCKRGKLFKLQLVESYRLTDDYGLEKMVGMQGLLVPRRSKTMMNEENELHYTLGFATAQRSILEAVMAYVDACKLPPTKDIILDTDGL